MKYQHIIEYALLALLVLVPVLALVNPGSTYRLNKIEAYLNFPSSYEDYTPTDRMMLEKARELLLKNGAEKYYDNRGLTCEGVEYIQQEEELMSILEQLACLPEGTYGLYYEPTVRECREKVRKDAQAMINTTIQQDLEFFDYTAKQNWCKVPRTGTFIEYGKRVIECRCGSQNWKLPIY